MNDIAKKRVPARQFFSRITLLTRSWISCAVAVFTLLAVCSIAQAAPPANNVYQHYNAALMQLYIDGEIHTYQTLLRLWIGQEPPPPEDEIIVNLGVFTYFYGFAVGSALSDLSVRTARFGHSINAKKLDSATPATTTGTYSLSSSTPAVPFVGNQMVVLGAVPFANNTNLSAVALRRQGDCSLVEDVFEPVNNLLTPTSSVELPGAQDYLHTLSGLTTIPDVFPEGCITDPTLGVTAVGSVEPVGVTANGLNLVAVLNGSLQINEINIASNATSTVTLSSSPSIFAFAVVDVNGDGLNDVVASGVTDPTTNMSAFAIYLNNGDGTFKPAIYVDALATVAFTVDDLNGDGKPDIVFSNDQNIGGAGANYITTLLGNGDGTFKAGVNTTISNGSGLNSLITGDFNGDGKKDVLFGSLVLLGKGDGTFTAGPALPAGVQGFAGFAASAAVGDFNKDGKLDVVYSSGVGGSGSVQIMLGNGDGSFQVGPRYGSIATGGQQVTVTDIDGDGNADIVVGTSSQGVYGADSADNLGPMFQILLGRGDGSFVAAPIYFDQSSTYQSVAQVVTGDFNGDGKADVLTIQSSASPSGTVQSLGMLAGDGTGKLGTAITSALNLTPQFIVAAKINKDTKLDAVLAGTNSTGAVLSVLLNQGNGSFAGEQDYALPAGATSLAVGDFNGDGIIDVAVGVSTGSSGSSSGVYVLLGQANGTLAAPVRIDSSVNPVSIAAADINGDGRADLAIADQGTNGPGATNGVNGALHVYLGNADATFTAAPAPTTAAGLYSQVAIGDLNKDGKPDLIIGGGSSGTADAPNVYTLLGNGDGTFQAAQVTALLGTDAAAPNSIAVADFNGDGKLDVIVGGQNDFTEVFLGQGDGTFAQGLMALAQQPGTLAAVDLNGDGLPELLVGTGSGLTVFINQPKWQAAAVGSATTTTLTAAPNPATVGQSVTLTATVASKATGTPTGTVSFLDGSTVLGSPSLTAQGTATFSTTTLAAATHTLTAQYSGDSTFAASTSSAVSLVVNAAAPAFAIAASPTSGSVAPGASATTTLTLTPSGGFTGTVTLACSGLPTGAACAFSSASVSVSGAAATSTLTISTMAMTAQNSLSRSGHSLDPFLPGSTLLAGMATPFIHRRRYRRRSRSGQALAWMGLLLVCAGVVALGGCGGSDGGSGPTPSGGTPAGTYTVTVTATSGSTSHTVAYALTVT